MAGVYPTTEEPMQKQIRNITWWGREELDVAMPFPVEQVEKARKEVDAALTNGFTYSEAVFVDAEFDGVHVKAHPTDGHKDWGRSDMYRRFIYRDGECVKDPTYVPEPPLKVWESHGLACQVRANGIGYNCGYVHLPPTHPWFRKKYSECLVAGCEAEWHYDCTLASHIDVHGGVTFAGEMWDGEWWVGFDCAHSGDACSPEYLRKMRKQGSDYGYEDGLYWDVDMVARETESLAEQLAAIK